ncbi:4095_t:CDS:2, partial [Ambispora leptoticha]
AQNIVVSAPAPVPTSVSTDSAYNAVNSIPNTTASDMNNNANTTVTNATT